MEVHKSVSVTDTTKLIRRCLKEAFPAVKFGVRSTRYAGGASIHVTWTDGPSTLQVEAITRRFAATYHDEMSDSWMPLWHRLNGQLVRFGSAHVFCHREHSDDWCAWAINEAYGQFRDMLQERGIERPRVRDFFDGRLHSIMLTSGEVPEDDPGDIPFGDGSSAATGTSMLDVVRELLDHRTSCLSPATSATAMAVTLEASDNRSGAREFAGWACDLH